MKLQEHESKKVFEAFGFPLPESGGVLRRPEELGPALEKLGSGPWVIKAQVLAGGRGKAGGIAVAKNEAEAKEAVERILGMELKTKQTQGQGLRVDEVLIEAAADIDRELYVSATLDRASGRPILIVSAEGGMEIEELSEKSPEKILKIPFSPVSGLESFEARKVVYRLGLDAELAGQMVEILRRTARVFLESDASLVEINPLVITKGRKIIALDAKVSLDENALYRQKALVDRPDLEASDLEKEAKDAGLSYIGLDGTIGCLVNGAGLAMGTMDMIKLAGGEPANFLDVGGSANEAQVAKAFQIIASDSKVRAILVNIFGGIMSCATIAKGIIGAMKKVELGVPLVVRLEGSEVEEGKRLLAESGIELITADTLFDAARKAVAASGEKA